MPDYSKGKIYKIVCNTTSLIYVGSTCEPTLARRLAEHKSKYKKYLNTGLLYLTSFEILKGNNYEIILIEDYSCKRKDELHMRERFQMEDTVCVNKLIPILTSEEKSEYYWKNQTYILQKKKEYREQNTEKIKKYLTEHRLIINEKAKQYRLEHKDEIKKRRNERNANKKLMILENNI